MAQNEKEKILDCVVAQGQPLESLIEYAEDSIVSKSILEKPAGGVTIFAFDKGQKLSEHTSPYNAIVQILAGSAIITIGDKKINAGKGQLIILPANVPHALNAEKKFKMLLTMIRE